MFNIYIMFWLFYELLEELLTTTVLETFSFSGYLLGPYYVSGTVFGPMPTKMIMISFLPPRSLGLQGGKEVLSEKKG